MKISWPLLAFLMLECFLAGVCLVAATIIPGGDVEDHHFPDFWTAECK